MRWKPGWSNDSSHQWYALELSFHRNSRYAWDPTKAERYSELIDWLNVYILDLEQKMKRCKSVERRANRFATGSWGRRIPLEIRGGVWRSPVQSHYSNPNRTTREVPQFAKEVHFKKKWTTAVMHLSGWWLLIQKAMANGWLKEPMDALKRQRRRLRQEVISILLSHWDWNGSSWLRSTSKVKWFLGPIRIISLKKGRMVNQTLLTSGFKYGAYIGELRWRWKESRGSFSDKNGCGRGFKEVRLLTRRWSSSPEGVALLKSGTPHIPAYSCEGNWLFPR